MSGKKVSREPMRVLRSRRCHDDHHHIIIVSLLMYPGHLVRLASGRGGATIILARHPEPSFTL